MQFRLFIVLAAVALCCVGCGGGGGGGGVEPPPPGPTTLGLTVDTPTLTGLVGQIVYIPVSVTGTGSVTTVSVSVKVDATTFESAVADSTTAQALTDLPAGDAACYKWLDPQTIRVLYVSGSGATSGTVIVRVPVKVKKDTGGSVALTGTVINQ